MHSRSTICLATAAMGRADLLGQLLGTLLPRAGRALQPGIIAAARDAEHAAQRFHGKCLTLTADKGELHGCCLAKKAVAFFKISRSMVKRLTSSRKRRTSTCRADSPFAGEPSSAANFFCQSARELRSTPRLLAAWATL